MIQVLCIIRTEQYGNNESEIKEILYRTNCNWFEPKMQYIDKICQLELAG